MIELNSKTQQDFLNRKWVQRLTNAGVDMSDAKYIIGKDKLSIYDLKPDKNDYVWYKDTTEEVYDVCPTYTVSELLYKLHEWIEVNIDGEKYSGSLALIKDAPFYIAYYRLRNAFTQEGTSIDNHIYAAFEYPIESLASLLIQCHEKGLGDVGDISNK